MAQDPPSREDLDEDFLKKRKEMARIFNITSPDTPDTPTPPSSKASEIIVDTPETPTSAKGILSFREIQQLPKLKVSDYKDDFEDDDYFGFKKVEEYKKTLVNPPSLWSWDGLYSYSLAADGIDPKPWKAWGRQVFGENMLHQTASRFFFGEDQKGYTDPDFSWEKEPYKSEYKKLIEGLPEGFAASLKEVGSIDQARYLRARAESVINDQMEMAEEWGQWGSLGLQIGGGFLDPANYLMFPFAAASIGHKGAMAWSTARRLATAGTVGALEGYGYGKLYEAADVTKTDHPDWMGPALGATFATAFVGVPGIFKQQKFKKSVIDAQRAGALIDDLGNPIKVESWDEWYTLRKQYETELNEILNRHQPKSEEGALGGKVDWRTRGRKADVTLDNFPDTPEGRQSAKEYWEKASDIERIDRAWGINREEIARKFEVDEARTVESTAEVVVDKTKGTQQVEFVNSETGERQTIPIEQVGKGPKPKDITPESVLRSKLWNEIDTLGEEEFNRRFREAGLVLQQEGRTSIESPWSTRGAAKDLLDWEIASKDLQERFGVERPEDIQIYKDAAAMAIEYRGRGEILNLNVLEHFTALRYRKDKARDILEFLYREGYATGEKLAPGIKVVWQDRTPEQMSKQSLEEVLKYSGEDYSPTFEFKELIPGLKMEDDYTYHYTVSPFGSELLPWFHTGTRQAAMDRAVKTARHGGRNKPPLGRVLMLPKPDLSDKTKWLYLPEDLGSWEPDRLIDHLVQMPEIIALKDEGLIVGLERIKRRFITGQKHVQNKLYGKTGVTKDPEPAKYTNTPEAQREIAEVLNSYGFEGGYYINAVEDPGSTSLAWFQPQDEFLKHFQTKLYAGVPIDTEEILAWIRSMATAGKKITQKAWTAILKLFRTKQERSLDKYKKVEGDLTNSDQKRLDFSEEIPPNEVKLRSRLTDLSKHLTSPLGEEKEMRLDPNFYKDWYALGFDRIITHLSRHRIGNDPDVNVNPSELLAQLNDLSPEALDAQMLERYREIFVEWKVAYYEYINELRKKDDPEPLPSFLGLPREVSRRVQNQEAEKFLKNLGDIKEIDAVRQEWTREAASLDKKQLFLEFMDPTAAVRGAEKHILQMYHRQLQRQKIQRDERGDLDQRSDYELQDHVEKQMRRQYPQEAKIVELGILLGPRIKFDGLASLNHEYATFVKDYLASKTPLGEWETKKGQLEALQNESREAIKTLEQNIEDEAIFAESLLEAHGLLNREALTARIADIKQAIKDKKNVGQRGMVTLPPGAGGNKPGKKELEVLRSAQKLAKDLLFPLGQEIVSQGPTRVGGGTPKTLEDVERRLRTLAQMGMPEKEAAKAKERLMRDLNLGAKVEEGVQDFDSYTTDLKYLEEVDSVFTAPEYPLQKQDVGPWKGLKNNEIDEVRDAINILSNYFKEELLPELARIQEVRVDYEKQNPNIRGKFTGRHLNKEERRTLKLFNETDFDNLPLIEYPRILNRLLRITKTTLGRNKAEVMILANLNLKHIKKGDPTSDWNRLTQDPVFRQEVLDSFKTESPSELSKERIKFLSTLHNIKTLQDIVTTNVDPLLSFIPEDVVKHIRQLGVAKSLHGPAKEVYEFRKRSLIAKLRKEPLLREKWGKTVGPLNKWFDVDGLDLGNIEEFRAGFTPRDLENLLNDIKTGASLIGAAIKNKLLVGLPPASVAEDLKPINTIVRAIKNGTVKLYNIYHPNQSLLVDSVQAGNLSEMSVVAARNAGIDPNDLVVRRVTPEMFLGDIDPDTGLPKRINDIISDENWNKGFKKILGGVHGALDLISLDHSIRDRALYKFYTEELERINWNLANARMELVVGPATARDAQKLATDQTKLTELIKRVEQRLETPSELGPIETEGGLGIVDLNNKINQSKETLIVLNELIRTTRLRIDNLVDIDTASLTEENIGFLSDNHGNVMSLLDAYTRLVSDRHSLERVLIPRYEHTRALIKDRSRNVFEGIVDPDKVIEAQIPDFTESKDFYAYVSKMDKRLKDHIDNQKINVLSPDYFKKQGIVKLFKAKREELNIIVNGYNAPSLYPEFSRLPARRDVFSILEKFFNIGGVKLTLNNKAIEAYKDVSYEKLYQRIQAVAEFGDDPALWTEDALSHLGYGDLYNPQLAKLAEPITVDPLRQPLDVIRYRELDLLDFAKVTVEQLNKVYSTEETLFKDLDYLGDLAEYKYLKNNKLREKLLTDTGIASPVLKSHINKAAKYLAEEVMRLKEIRESIDAPEAMGTKAKKRAEFAEKAWFLSNYGTSPAQLLEPLNVFRGKVPSIDIPHQIGITEDFPYSLQTNYDLAALTVWLRDPASPNATWLDATESEAFTFFRNKITLDVESHLRVAFNNLEQQMDAELAPVATFEELARGDVEWGVRAKDDPDKTTYFYAGLPPFDIVDPIKAFWGIITEKAKKFSLFFNGKDFLKPDLPPLVRKDPASNFIGTWGKDENNLVIFSDKLPNFIKRLRSRRGRSQVNELGLIRKFGQWVYGSERLRVDAGDASEGVNMAAAQTLSKSTLLEQGAVKARTRILGEYTDRVMSARDRVIKDTLMPRKEVDDIDVIVQDTVYVVYQRLQKSLGASLGLNDGAVIDGVMQNYPDLTREAAKSIVNYAKELNDIKTDFLKRHIGVDIESLNLVTKVDVTDLRRFAGVFEELRDVNINNEELLRFLKTDVLNEVRSGIEYDDFSNFAQKLIDDENVIIQEGTLKEIVIPDILNLLDQYADFSTYENILQIIDTFGLDQVLKNPQKLLLSKEISDDFNVNMLKPYSDEPFVFWDSLRDLNQIAAYGQIEKMLGDSVKGAEIGVLTPRQEELIKNIVGSQGDFRGRMQEVINSYLGHIIYKNISRNANDGTSIFGNFTKDSWGKYLQKNTVDNQVLTESPTFPIDSIEDTGDLVVSIDKFIRNYFFENDARLKLELDFDKPHKIELQSNAAETQKLSMDRLNTEHGRLKGKIRSDELITDDIRLKDLPVTTPKDELAVMFGKLITARIESDFIKEFNTVLKSEGLYHKEFTKGEDIFEWIKDNKDILIKQGVITNGKEFDLMIGMLERDLLGQKPTDAPREVDDFVQMMQKGATATSIFGFGIPAMLESALPIVSNLPHFIRNLPAMKEILLNPRSVGNEGLKDFLRGAGVGTEANLFKGSGSSRKSIIFDDKNPMIKNPNALPPLGNKDVLQRGMEKVEEGLALVNPFQYPAIVKRKLGSLASGRSTDRDKSLRTKTFDSMIDQQAGFMNFFTRKGQDIAAKAFISRVIDKVKVGDFDNFVDPNVAAQIGWSPEDRATIYRELRKALDTIPETEIRGVSMYDIPSMVNGDSSKGWTGMSGRTRDKFLSGIYNYVGQQIVRPDLGDLPRFMDNKFLSFLMQFRGFGMAEFGKRIGPTAQRVGQDPKSWATAALASMLLMNGVYAVLTYTLTFPEETKKDLERMVGTRRSKADLTSIVTGEGLKTRVDRAFLGGLINSFTGLTSITTDPILDALDFQLYTEWFDSSWRGPAANMAESVAAYRYGKNLGKYPYEVLTGDKDIDFEEASKWTARQTGMYRVWQLFRLMNPDTFK